MCRIVAQQLQLSSHTTVRRSGFTLILWSIHKMTNIKIYAFHASIKFHAFSMSGKQKVNLSYKYFM